MRAAIYARYSSENQRPESIDDQVSSCKKLAATRGFTVDDSLIFPDEATSGARSDRKGLASLLAASAAKKFDVVLVDDLSRLARDNYLMLSLMAELHFNGVRVVSVADGLDTGDEEAKLGDRKAGSLRLRPRTHKCFFANARPDGDFRYFSNPNARASSSNRTATMMVHGRYFDVWGLIPELCATRRRSGSSVMPT